MSLVLSDILIDCPTVSKRLNISSNFLHRNPTDCTTVLDLMASLLLTLLTEVSMYAKTTTFSYSFSYMRKYGYATSAIHVVLVFICKLIRLYVVCCGATGVGTMVGTY